MTKPITTTLNAIRKHSPCEGGWGDLLKHLGKTKSDDEPLKFSTILESNGIADALWCLRALPEGYHPKIRHLAADYAERVLHLFEKAYPKDDRPRKAIQAARDFADGKITQKARATAWAAGDAARATAWAAAGDAAWAAAGDAAGAAAGDAAGAAAWAAAWAAARAAAWAAAGDAEKKIQAELLIKYFG